ncbi:MAG: hypothetical protein IPQ07_40485 [Myxococcales bacterium]|nr:hypothetical protein [Myxococcales bacterium]
MKLKWAVLVLACGCNQVFGLNETTSIDGSSPESLPPPPPPECPAIGVVPAFRSRTTQLPVPGCISYTVGATHAMGVCAGEVSRGNIDQALSAVTITPRPAYIIDTRVDPSLDRFLLTTTVFESGRTNLVFFEYQLQPNGDWVGTRGYTLGQTASSISTPSGGSDRLAVYGGSAGALVEIHDDGTGAGWVGRMDHVIPEVMAMGRVIIQPSLSPDGRRLMFVVADDFSMETGVVYYADRASIADPFVTAHAVDSLPSGIGWPQMTADCGRLYYAALGTVFYAEQ